MPGNVVVIEQLQILRTRVEQELRENQRLGYGAGAIAVLMVIYGLSAFSDFVESRYQKALDRGGAFAGQVRIAEQVEWRDRVIESRALRGTLENGLWTAETPGLAAAGFQDWIQESAKRSGLGRVRIRINNSEESTIVGNNELRRIQAEVSADFNAEALEKFLRVLEYGDQLVVVNELDTTSKAPPRIRMLVSIYLRVTESVSAVRAGPEAVG